MMLRSWIRRRLTRTARKVTRPFRPALVTLEERTVPAQIGNVFYIDLENHLFTQPNGNVDTNSMSVEQIRKNPAAPYINGLIDGTDPNSPLVSYATNYHNVLSTSSGGNPSIHPSEPNYVWQESGTFGPLNGDDLDPFPGHVVNAPNLTGLLQTAGISWKSYQEDIDLMTSSGPVNQPGPNALSSNVAPQGQWTVPLTSFHGTSASYTNTFNLSDEYAFAAKHDGTLFFTATNGGNDPTHANPETSHYAPLQQLKTDLGDLNNPPAVGRYNLITPDLFNDMHDALLNGFKYPPDPALPGPTYTGDAAQIAQGDYFLSQVIPMIVNSPAFGNNGMIVIWTDETVVQDGSDATPNDFNHDLTEIVISPLARGNDYASTLNYTHSSDLKTLQEVFGVQAPGVGFLGDAGTPGTNDLSDLFQPGTIPLTIANRPLPTGATIGTAVADQATVGGGSNPMGTVTFNLYGNPNGTGAPLFTDTETLVNGTATSKAYTPAAIGTYYWVAAYSGDGNNPAISSVAANGPVTIRVPPPAPTPTPTPVRRMPSLITRKAGKKGKAKLYIHVTFSDGRAAEDVLSPFQKPGFKNIAVSVDAAGDVVVTAHKGKKTVRQTVSA